MKRRKPSAKQVAEYAVKVGEYMASGKWQKLRGRFRQPWWEKIDGEYWFYTPPRFAEIGHCWPAPYHMTAGYYEEAPGQFRSAGIPEKWLTDSCNKLWFDCALDAGVIDDKGNLVHPRFADYFGKMQFAYYEMSRLRRQTAGQKAARNAPESIEKVEDSRAIEKPLTYKSTA